jgi:hypothetical protein
MARPNIISQDSRKFFIMAKLFNFSAWDWVDGVPLHHWRRVSTAYAGVLLDTDGSMKWYTENC